MAQFLYEDFEGPNGTPLGQFRDGWKQIAGATGGLLLDGGAVRHNGQVNSAAYYRADILASSPDYSVSADIYNGNGLPSILGRVSSDAQTFYCARTNGNTIELYRFVSGSASLMGSQATGLTGLRVYNLRLEMIGATIQVFVDGAASPILSFISAHIAGPGYVGVRQNQSNSPFGTIDNLIASTPDSGPGPVSGVLAATLGAATISSSAQTPVSAALSRNLEPAILSSAGRCASTAGFANTLEPAALAASAHIAPVKPMPDGVEVTLSKVLADPALLTSAGLAVRSWLSLTLAGPTLSAVAVTGDRDRPPFDISKIHPSRIVLFEGSGSRVTAFSGSGSRATPFEGSGSRVTPFEGSGSKVTRFE